MDNPRKRAPRSCRTGISSHRVRGGPGACIGVFFRGPGSEDRSATWSAESTSGTAFHNASRRFQPRREPVRPRLLPGDWHRGQPPLLTLALKTEPALTEFARDRYASLERGSPPLRSLPPLRIFGIPLAARWSRPAVGLSSLRCGWCHQPHLPPLARRVEKRPITHARSSVACLRAKVLARDFCFAGRVPQRAQLAASFCFFSNRLFLSL